MNGLSPEEKQQALIYAYNGADFTLAPTTELCEKIIKGSIEAKGINRVMIAILLQKKPIRLDSNTVIQYCKGALDKNNTWLFNNSNIRVVPPRYKKPVKLKPKEENKKKENKNEK